MKEKIILQKDVEHLGLAGEVVEVQRGYAWNYLLPKSLAVVATPANQKMLAETMSTVEERKKRQEERARGLAAKLEGLTLTIGAKVGETGRLFGSVTSMDLAKALAEEGHDFDRKRIELKAPIKSLGQHEFTIRLEAGVTASLKVEVVKEGED
ncbi:MAG: 50S ribosomal protein L9 [Deltaproteobacteria bacterium]|nr:50S ribosomal protein L9 [Deltaproteobacteria bacterium]